jgi:DNA-binding NtrC family response regulator
MAEVLLVDDEEKYARILARVLSGEGHSATVATQPAKALQALEARAFDVVVSDIRMPGMDGVSLVKRIRELSEDTDVVLMTAHATVETAVEAIRLGVREYLLKPFPNQDLVAAVNRLEHQRVQQQEVDHLRAATRVGPPVGESEALRRAREQVERLADSDATILLRGETGTGKEVFARHVHTSSPRAGEPFLALNVAALPSDLLEAELFGYEKGAFTGADRGRPGKLEAAARGTVFLDEVGEIPLELQAKLLRILEVKEYRRLGGVRLRRMAARVVAATNRDLEEAVRDGTFREDLYYRLNVAEVELPPLRERRGDVRLLAEHLLADLAPGVRVHPEALRRLEAYEWPGNVRELSNVLQRAALLGSGGEIRAEDLRLRGAARALESETGGPDSSHGVPEGFRLEEWELGWVKRAMEIAGGVKTEAARLLGISRRQLDSRLRRLENAAP